MQTDMSLISFSIAFHGNAKIIIIVAINWIPSLLSFLDILSFRGHLFFPRPVTAAYIYIFSSFFFLFNFRRRKKERKKIFRRKNIL